MPYIIFFGKDSSLSVPQILELFGKFATARQKTRACRSLLPASPVKITVDLY
jgi:hypothetical protein